VMGFQFAKYLENKSKKHKSNVIKDKVKNLLVYFIFLVFHSQACT